MIRQFTPERHSLQEITREQETAGIAFELGKISLQPDALLDLKDIVLGQATDEDMPDSAMVIFATDRAYQKARKEEEARLMAPTSALIRINPYAWLPETWAAENCLEMYKSRLRRQVLESLWLTSVNRRIRTGSIIERFKSAVIENNRARLEDFAEGHASPSTDTDIAKKTRQAVTFSPSASFSQKALESRPAPTFDDLRQIR